MVPITGVQTVSAFIPDPPSIVTSRSKVNSATTERYVVPQFSDIDGGT